MLKYERYEVVSGHHMCHPETCCCSNWQMVGPDVNECYRDDDKKWLQEECARLNKQLDEAK